MDGHCKNYGNVVRNKYCDSCGQATSTGQIDFRYLFTQLTSVFSIDRGFLYTIKQLFVRPGHAIRDYLAGKRVGYSSPFGLVFILATIYVVLSYWLNAQIDTSLYEFPNTQNDLAYKLSIAMQRQLQFLYSYFAYIQLLSIPFLSFCSYMLFKKDGYSYAEHWVINAYVVCA